MSWTECLNPFNVSYGEHRFFRYTTLSKYYTPGDTAKLCPICWFKAHSINEPIAAYRPIKNIKEDAKPEKDTL